ncbi:hypothetical protein FRC06_010229, partial [Ceratobasidium sp. 370]
QPEAPRKNPFDFASVAAPTTSKSSFEISNAAKPAEKPTSPFVFGAPTPAPASVPAPAATEKKSLFDFSSIPKPASASFVFGTSTPTPAAPATNGFTFGAPAPPRPSTPPSGGDAAMEESPTREPAKIVTSGFGNSSGFGAQPPNSGFAFGGNTNGTGASSTGAFGGPLNTGSAPQTNGFSAPAAPASPAPFAFGANNGAGSGFGSNGFNTNGSATPSFTFGAGAGFPQPASASASPSNPFTQPATSTPFGQPNPAPSNAFTTPASPFPAPSPALSAVGFNNNSAPPNAFGSTQPATNGFPASPATQPGFTFGASAPTAGTASPSTFTFGLPAGGVSSPATPTATSAPFVFGQAAEQGSPAAGVQFNLGTADASPGDKSEEEILGRVAKKTLDRIFRGPRDGFIKKPSRGLDDKKEVRDAILGRIAARPTFQSQTNTVFSTTETRPEDLEAPGDDEGGVELRPEMRIELGSFVELRRNGYAQWGISLGYDVTFEGIEVIRTLLTSGETIKHPPRDIQFSLAGFAPYDLARRAGEGKYADQKNPVEMQARIALGKRLRSLSRRIEQTSHTVQNAADKLYEHARHPDGKTWSKITLAEGVALVAGDGNPTLESMFAVHQHFMDNPLRYIADTFDHRLSNTFAVRPLEDVRRIERVINWVRNNDPLIDEFAAKARVIIEANTARKKESRDEDPTWVESSEGLPELNEADRNIVDFCRCFLRQRRELQENPCSLTLPLILNKISPSYLPLVGHSVFRALEDLSVLAPWSNHVMQDIDLQLHEFTDTLDTPLPGGNDAPPVAPVTINDNRVSGAKTIDGLDNMRHDFGNMPVYVVDDVTAEELDDGVSVERTTDGSDNVWLHIHIADPTSALRPDDPLAVCAYRRSATAYFPDATFPMLPPTDLSLGALAHDGQGASMNVLTFSTLVSPAGELLKCQVRPGVVRRVHVLQYDDVTHALGESLIDPIWPFGEPTIKKAARKEVPSEALPDLQLIHQTAKRLAKARVAKTDSVLWSQPRPHILMDKASLLTDHDPRPLPRIYRGSPKIQYSVEIGTIKDVRHALDASRAMVAECMITAGRITSLFAQEHGVPMIYRALARPVGIGADSFGATDAYARNALAARDLG